MEKQLVIVIGLPGSGKTTYCKKFKEYLLFDDFVTNIFNYKAICELKAGEKVCLNDPRLCYYDIFEMYITKFEKCIAKENIQLIIYENNPEQCITNIKIRGDDMWKTVNQYSEKYSITNYAKWNPTILPVYSN